MKLIRNEANTVLLSDEKDTGGNVAVDRYGRFMLSALAGGGITYNATPPVLADGETVGFQGDTAGNLKVYLASLLSGEDVTNNVLGTVRKHPIVSTYSPSVSTSFGTATTANAKNTAGILKGFSVSNVNAAIRYFQIFNTTGATTPVLFSFPIAAGSATVPQFREIGKEIFGDNGYYLSTGITWGLSTTRDSYVAGTATDHQVHLFYY